MTGFIEASRARDSLEELDLVNGWRLFAVQTVAFLQGAGWARRKALAHVAKPIGISGSTIWKWERRTLPRYLGIEAVEVARAGAWRASGAAQELPAGAKAAAIRFAAKRFEVTALGSTPADQQISALCTALWLGRRVLKPDHSKRSRERQA